MSGEHMPLERLREALASGDHLESIGVMVKSEDLRAVIAIAEATTDLLAALRWLHAFWQPGSDHDTQEVQLALAAADAAIQKARG